MYICVHIHLCEGEIQLPLSFIVCISPVTPTPAPIPLVNTPLVRGMQMSLNRLQEAEIPEELERLRQEN